ncbi:putative hydroxypyruvate reductase [Rubripirellula obstinata]|uniref:Putative hydroxypyruvate reductase n=1 Tax=Rubripirellula obstinata TaxID=406547 RepID=A0A5B1CSN8_9BACT|nr:putative hydroxypyruvate reductase [Rubripirellula obstinata]
MRTAKDDAIEIWNAGVAAVLARPLVIREVVVSEDSNEDSGELWISGHNFDGRNFDRVIVVGAGKAASAMADGLVSQIGDWRPVSGWVNVPEGTEKDIAGVVTHPARPASVNEPTAAGILGTEQIMQIVGSAGPRDLVLAVICGGGSALLPLPADGISLDDKLSVIRHLSGSGATIDELNTVRKHLSKVKGGGLLRACRGRHLVTLMLSDVLGDPVDLIASGPTVVDPSSTADALAVLAKFDPDRTLSESIYQCLEDAPEPVADSNLVESTVVMLGNNALAVDEAGIVAESLGYNHVMQSATSSEGPAEDVGRHLADMVVQMLRADPNAHRTDCLITGGEPTVTLAPSDVRGKGGRNQQLVLAAYQQLLTHDLSQQEWGRVVILSGGTDGEDGPTDAAGAFIDANVHRSAESQSLNIADHLRRNDAYHFFKATGGLLMTGPTGTNVCDIRVGLVKERATFHSRLSLRESSGFATFAERKATLISRSFLSRKVQVPSEHKPVRRLSDAGSGYSSSGRRSIVAAMVCSPSTSCVHGEAFAGVIDTTLGPDEFRWRFVFQRLTAAYDRFHHCLLANRTTGFDRSRPSESWFSILVPMPRWTLPLSTRQPIETATCAWQQMSVVTCSWRQSFRSRSL